jgi:uncharacterized protein YdeI (YjbR/CyaY-like superfamily)
MAKTPEVVQVRNRAEWRAWLENNHTQTESILLVTYRQDAGDVYIPYEELVEEALCFGWIDSTRRRLDDRRASLLMAPRKAGSGWAHTNKMRVERLIAADRMAPAGMAKIAEARNDGSWTRLDDVEALVVPDDLALALARHPGAEQHFASFPPSSRKLILGWIKDAKRPETRAKRVEETALLALRNERAHHPR